MPKPSSTFRWAYMPGANRGPVHGRAQQIGNEAGTQARADWFNQIMHEAGEWSVWLDTAAEDEGVVLASRVFLEDADGSGPGIPVVWSNPNDAAGWDVDFIRSATEQPVLRVESGLVQLAFAFAATPGTTDEDTDDTDSGVVLEVLRLVRPASMRHGLDDGLIFRPDRLEFGLTHHMTNAAYPWLTNWTHAEISVAVGYMDSDGRFYTAASSDAQIITPQDDQVGGPGTTRGFDITVDHAAQLAAQAQRGRDCAIKLRIKFGERTANEVPDPATDNTIPPFLDVIGCKVHGRLFELF